VHSCLIPYWTLFLQFLLLLGGSCAIDGYDEAPSCSSFTPGSFDIDVIFHVHCTKPVWCVTSRTSQVHGSCEVSGLLLKFSEIF